MTDWQPNEDRKPLTRKQWVELFMLQNGRCPCCDQRLQVKGAAEVWDEHLKPLSMGGSNELGNRALYCKPCAKTKTKAEAQIRAKSNRIRDKAIGAFKKRSTFKTNRDAPFKKKMDGTVEKRT